MRISDWSSDVCSSDLDDVRLIGAQPHQCLGRAAERRLVVGEGGAQRSDHLGGESRPKVDHFGNRAAAAVEFDPVGGDSMDPVGVDGDRKSVVWVKSCAVRVALGGRRIIKNKKNENTT